MFGHYIVESLLQKVIRIELLSLKRDRNAQKSRAAKRVPLADGST
jgi:hypothetical protein